MSQTEEVSALEPTIVNAAPTIRKSPKIIICYIYPFSLPVNEVRPRYFNVLLDEGVMEKNLDC